MVRRPSRHRRGWQTTAVLARTALVAVLSIGVGACRPDTRPSLVPAPTTVPSVGVGPDDLPPDPSCAGVPIGVQDITLEAGGAVHPVRIAVPATFTGARSPVVVSWHTLGADGAAQARLTGFEELAETEGFIVVHPTGVPNAGDARTAWQLVTSPPDPTHDDVAFARALLDEIVVNWCGDSSRLYMAGMAHGGFFTSRLVCEMADRIAAAISVGGLSHPDTCTPARPVPYLAFHGTADEYVPYTGNGRSVLLGTGELPSELFTSSIPAEVAQFATDWACDPVPTDTEFDTRMLRRTYTGCDGDIVLSLVEMVNGGHLWPRAPEWPLDATVDGWAFLSQFRL